MRSQAPAVETRGKPGTGAPAVKRDSQFCLAVRKMCRQRTELGVLVWTGELRGRIQVVGSYAAESVVREVAVEGAETDCSSPIAMLERDCARDGAGHGAGSGEVGGGDLVELVADHFVSRAAGAAGLVVAELRCVAGAVDGKGGGGVVSAALVEDGAAGATAVGVIEGDRGGARRIDLGAGPAVEAETVDGASGR